MLHKDITTALAEIKDQVKNLITAMKTAVGFKIGDPIPSLLNTMASSIDNGRNAEAVRVGEELLKAGRSILGAFIRYSIVDREVNDQKRTAMFKRERETLIAEKFDDDLVAQLSVAMDALLEAIKTETNGVFDFRLQAYNTCKMVLNNVRLEQERRDRYAVVIAETRNGNGKGKKVNTGERDRLAGLSQRQQMLAQRREEADELRNLL